MSRRWALFLLALAALAVANTAAGQNFQQRTSGFAYEIAKNWAALSVLAILLSVILVAIAYAIGIGFEMPEIKAWAGTELAQIIANAIIVAGMMGVLAFVELLVLGVVASSGIGAATLPSCYGGVGSGNSTSCLQGVTSAYLDGYVNTATSAANDVLRNNVDAAGMAGRRIGLYCLTIYCLQIGATTTIAGHYVIKSDTYTILFEYYTNLLGFMEAQQFLVEQICFRMMPVILAIGIVARSFFFTRKLGGLLMAIAIGMMFFLPGMYVFDWVTLDTTINGDKGTSLPYSCPATCSLVPPLAYTADGVKLTSPNDVYAAFSSTNPSDLTTAAGILGGSVPSAPATTDNTSSPVYGKTILSCYYQQVDSCPTNCRTGLQDCGSDSDCSSGQSCLNGLCERSSCASIPACSSPPPTNICPTVCRQLPYPNAPNCVNQTIQQACAQIPVECKVVHYVVPPDFNQTEYDACPADCKVVPPLNSNCNVHSDGVTPGGNCLASSMDCRLAYRNDLSYRPTKQAGDDDATKAAAAQCALASDCAASLDANQSCVFVMPQTGLCSDICGGCPQQCRIDSFATTPASQLPDSCKDSGGNYLAACTSCTSGCKVRMAQIQALDSAASGNNSCGSCPDDHRIVFTDTTGVPADYLTGACSYAQCKSDFRVIVPRNACEMCLYSQPSYMYAPAIDTMCSDECKPSDSAPVADPATFTKVGGNGLVGLQEVQDLSKLLIPVYLLPLFNIVATLVFIKGLSGWLGGDIEIPGLSRLF